MKTKEIKSVPFDPGITKHYPPMDDSLIDQVEAISKLKATNQRKFQFQIMEKQLTKSIQTIAAIYYGCVIYGSTIAFKYKQEPALIRDNPILEMSEEELETLDLAFEPRFIIELYQKLNKNIVFNLKRKSKLMPDAEKYINQYIKFVELNNHFKDLKTTEHIKVPEETQVFSTYSMEELDNLEKKLIKIAQIGNVDEILNIS